MNLKKTVISTLAIATLALGACGDDDPAPKKQFTFADETVSLKDATIYLEYNGSYNGHIYRDYYISDADANGDNGTYYIEVELAVPDDKEIKSGSYPAFYDWDLASETSNIAYVYAEMGDDNDYVEIELPEDANGDDKVTVSGGVDDGDTMTVKFNGSVTYYHYDTETEDWVTETVTGKFYFKGKVEDISSAPTKKKHTVPGGKGNLAQ